MLELQNHNPRELARKIDPLKNACKKFIDFIQKNKHLKDVTREDARAFHKELQRRIYYKEIATNTANKCLTNLRVLIDTYHNENDIDKDNVFRGLRFTENQSKRSPLNTRYIANNWINNPVLDNTTQELKYMLWVMIDTGCGFKELCGLDPDTDSHLETEIPYIEIRENEKRKIKTSFRSRKIPLIGLALEAFQNFPRGFRSYNTCNGPTNASAALNKFLKSNNLFENNKQTVYSARHCFKDRLRNHNVPAEMQDYLMGHKSPGMGSHYGNGYSLQQMRDALLLIEKDFK